MEDFPLLPCRGMKIPWSVAEQAFLGYEKKYGRGQTLETIAKRGGFGVEEMDEFHPEWREHIKLKALAASRKKLLRRAHAMLETGMPHLIELIEEIGCELAEELGDES